AYLVRHAGRVVPKDELMEALWPDVHVTEASLQRAVSLARRALREGEVEGALKSFPGHGYRFSIDQPALGKLLPTPPQTNESQLATTRACVAARQWARAVAEFEAHAQPLGAADLELWAFSVECSGRPADAVPILRRAVEAYEGTGARIDAARCAVTLGKIYFERGDAAVARGWLARANTSLEGQAPGDALAYLKWMQSRYAAFEGNPQEALAVAEEARSIADANGTQKLRALTLGYVGFYNISLGRIRQGLAQQDHAAALAMSSAVDPITGGLIYCNILWSCRSFADWARGQQWAEGFEAWCDANLDGVSASCRLHRAEVLSAKGTLREALDSIDGAIERLPATDPWALGDAYRVRGDVLAALGDDDGARREYDRAYQIGWDGEPGNAILLHLAGDNDGALAALDRVLANTGWFGLQRRGWILANKALICARAGKVEAAGATLDLLSANFDDWPSAGVRALALEAQSHLPPTGDVAPPMQLLSLARQLWTSIGAEYQATRVRLVLAQVLMSLHDFSGAEVEINCAAQSAATMGATQLQRACVELKAQLAKRPDA
ncbi:MAG TPA: winged helix-turn-helix domain-containing protein, partial [Verrucomicrobiae bacterium]|nr:winged helix-turn-helix domain-containing protein [Verrucomicrobiae bacterium]